MKHSLITTLIGVAVVTVSLQIGAQTPSHPKDRASVKAEGAAATKSGESPAGERAVPPIKAAVSAKSRADVKSETSAADKTEVNRAGERSVPAPKKAMTTQTRDEVKADTRSAIQTGEIIKGGELAASQAKKK